MVRLYFYVEGQTEQEYVRRVLMGHLAGFGVQGMGAVLAASGRRHRVVSRGGGKHHQPMRNDLGRLLRHEGGADVRFTTLSPELVNDGETTAPSKRIISQFPQYSRQKTTIGAELADCVGIDMTRRLCPHFDRWLKTLESLGAP